MPYPVLATPQRSYRVFPSPVVGYAIDGRWEVVESVGLSVVNLVSNPSVELDTTGFSAQGAATIARDATDQRRGVYSLRVTPTSAQLDGAFYATVSLIGGSTYTFSFDLKGAGGIKYRFYVASTLNNSISPVISVTATGRWQRVNVTFREPTTAGVAILRRLYITKDYSSSTAPFRIDGLAVYPLPYPVTYFDGDSVGFVIGRNDFYWNGTRHGSTSTMTSFTRAGGKITPFSKFGFAVLAMLGLGMQPLLNVATAQAFIGGSQYQRTVSQDRVFDIVGALTGRSLQELQSKRRKLIDLFKPDATPTDTPLLLLYTPVDDCGVGLGETLEIACVYESGLQGKTDNHYQENMALRFHSFRTSLANATGDNGQTLGYQIALSSGFAFTRDTSGNWSRLGDGLNAGVSVILPLPDGRVLVGGAFTNASGVADADRLAVYDYGTNAFTALNATPLNGAVFALSLLPDGNTVLVGGLFTNAGGAASADFLCSLNLTTGAYSALNATPLSAQVNSIYTLQDGRSLIGGDFLNAGGSANADFLTLLTGGVFSALNATPLNGSVIAVHELLNGNAVIGGQFTNAGGDANADFVALVTMSTGAYSALNSTPTAIDGRALEVGLDGKLYIGRATGVADTEITTWAGAAMPFIELGSGVNNAVNIIRALRDNTIIIGGDFSTAGGLTLPGTIVGWNGSSYFFIDIQPGGNLQSIAETVDGKLIIGSDGAGTGPAASVTTVNNSGTSDAYPIFEMLGPGSVYQIKNYSTNDVLYFNLILNTGERAILDLTPGRIRFYSNFRANLLGTILPGSDLATFRLAPGNNSISVFIAGSVTAATAVTIRWRECHWSLDSAVDTP